MDTYVTRSVRDVVFTARVRTVLSALSSVRRLMDHLDAHSVVGLGAERAAPQR